MYITKKLDSNYLSLSEKRGGALTGKVVMLDVPTTRFDDVRIVSDRIAWGDEFEIIIRKGIILIDPEVPKVYHEQLKEIILDFIKDNTLVDTSHITTTAELCSYQYITTTPLQ